MDNGQWSMDNGQWTVDNGHSCILLSAVFRVATPYCGTVALATWYVIELHAYFFASLSFADKIDKANNNSGISTYPKYNISLRECQVFPLSGSSSFIVRLLRKASED